MRSDVGGIGVLMSRNDFVILSLVVSTIHSSVIYPVGGEVCECSASSKTVDTVVIVV